MQRNLTADQLCLVLAKSRTEQNRSQKYMAKAMHRSIGTVQNWEYGLSAPNVLELCEWFDVLGVNPLRYILDILHPNEYSCVGESADDAVIKSALEKYLLEIATDRERRELAFCIFGKNGSSWHFQLEMFCALNHLPLIDRVNLADSVANLYEMHESRGELWAETQIKPDIDGLKDAVALCKDYVRNGKGD